MYISQQHCPNFRVLGVFRKNNLPLFHDAFKQNVKMAIKLEMASLGHISLAGSKFKANSSKHKAMSYGRLKTKKANWQKKLKNLSEKRISVMHRKIKLIRSKMVTACQTT